MARGQKMVTIRKAIDEEADLLGYGRARTGRPPRAGEAGVLVALRVEPGLLVRIDRYGAEKAMNRSEVFRRAAARLVEGSLAPALVPDLRDKVLELFREHEAEVAQGPKAHATTSDLRSGGDER